MKGKFNDMRISLTITIFAVPSYIMNLYPNKQDLVDFYQIYT